MLRVGAAVPFPAPIPKGVGSAASNASAPKWFARSGLRRGAFAAKLRPRQKAGASVGWGLWALDAALREVLLFAAFGFLVGGLDDLVIDLIYIARRLSGRGARLAVDALPRPATAGRLAMFVPAWDEVSVIGAMLRSAVSRLDHLDYRIYVGVYPNDPGTIDAVSAVAADEPRVRLVIGPGDGPTTKGDNLNALWRALQADDAAEGFPTRAVVLHDAEDVVHPAELRVYDALLDRHAMVQLPVQPLIREQEWPISDVYADEFAEAHAKLMVVRGMIGARLPLAGVGCAIRCDALHALADRRGGAPFDPQSLTEDYELGLHLSQLGYTSRLARVADGGDLVATRAYFPDDLLSAVRQKSRWMNGIALAGWDRMGWGRPLAFTDHWIRARDRRAPLAMLVLAAGYLVIPLWSTTAAAHWLADAPMRPLEPLLVRLIELNFAFLLWRLACRVAFTTRFYGWREGVRAVPRVVVGNLIALLAVIRAVRRYMKMLSGGATVWDKTAHRFPTLAERGA
jgi:adsorption protein B